MNRLISRSPRTVRSFYAVVIALSLAGLFGSLPALLAANPSSGTLAANGKLEWDGFTGVAASPQGETTCVEGINCDTFTVTIAPGDYTGKRVRFRVTWGNQLNDYDVYAHRGSNAGPVVQQAGDGAPETVEENTFDLNTVVTAGENDKYTIRTVYWAVATPDPYHGVLTIEDIGGSPERTATYLKDDKSGIRFSRNRTVWAPAAGRDGEPSIRVDYQGTAYVGAIRGLTGGNDLWRFDLNSDPMLRTATVRFDPFGNAFNPAWMGQPDAIAPNNQEDLGGDGGGDMDIAVGHKPSALNPTGPPVVATTSLMAANVSAQRSTDRGETFVNNPAGNVTVPVDDRQWNEFYGGDVVYLGYRELVGLQATAKFYVNRSEDGGLTYGPALLAGLGGNLVGNIDVDQTNGTVYFCYQGPGTTGNKQVKISVGKPLNPAVAPATYSEHIAVTAQNDIGHIFPVCKSANDGKTIYVAYSDGGNAIYLVHSADQGTTWSQPVRVSDLPAPSASVMPWIETGNRPGSLAVVWYGAEAADSEDGSGLNNNAANWKVYFASTLDANTPSPTFYQTVASDHFIHGSNISTSGLVVGGESPNRNLIDFFQVAIDPQGMAMIAYTDDSNDFSGHTYVTRQTAGRSLHTGAAVTISGDDSEPPRDPAAPEVQDFRHDARTVTIPPTVPDIDSPPDVISIDYGCELNAQGKTLITATMRTSGLNSVPPDSFWRMNFASHPTKPGLSDRADQWFLRAGTDLNGVQSFSYGTAVRNTDGSITYTIRGAADAGAFDTNNRSVTVKTDIDKLNALQTRGAIGEGTTFIGLRGSSTMFVSAIVNAAGVTSVGPAMTDVTRGGTSFTLDASCFPTPPPDLQVTNITASSSKTRVTINAIVANTGKSTASASKTEFLLDGATVLGLVDTPEIPAGGSAQVNVNWDTKGVKGEHTIRATADKTALVSELSETNNAATRTVTVHGNKVQNGSFEQSSSGTSPDAWSGSSTAAGSATWTEGGSDGSRSVSISGNGGNAALSGSPSWTSAPITVTTGEMLDFTVAVRSDGVSSAASAGLVYLGAAGQVIDTVALITAPLTTNSFATLEQTVTIPAGVAQVRVKLTGFAPTDLATGGKVTFDAVGLYAK
jgi:hypothetical protein